MGRPRGNAVSRYCLEQEHVHALVSHAHTQTLGISVSVSASVCVCVLFIMPRYEGHATRYDDLLKAMIEALELAGRSC